MKRAVGMRDGAAVSNQTLDHAAHPSQRRTLVKTIQGNLSRYLEDDLTHSRAFFHVVHGGGRFFEREGLVDDWF